MKNYKIIDDAIYEIAAQRIGRRRRNPTAGLTVLGAGLLLIGAVHLVGEIGRDTALGQGLLLAGLILAFAGLVKAIIDFTSRGKLYYKPSGSELRRYEIRFDTPYTMKVCQALVSGDFASLSGIPHGRTSSVRAVIYKSTDNGIIMTQVLESQKPLTETRMFEGGNFTLSGILG